MNVDLLLTAFDLPSASRVNQRVPKKLLLENGAPTTADKRHIKGEVEELSWLAALKPTTIGVPAYRDDIREYLEIAVLRLTLRLGDHVLRLVELVHRAVPYPVLLLTQQSGGGQVSAVHKRGAQNETDKVVLDGGIVLVKWQDEQQGKHEVPFLQALAVFRQPRASLYLFYQGWIDTLLAMQAATVTDKFRIATDSDEAAVAPHGARGSSATGARGPAIARGR